jgi:hypothetical protein
MRGVERCGLSRARRATDDVQRTPEGLVDSADDCASGSAIDISRVADGDSATREWRHIKLRVPYRSWRRLPELESCEFCWNSSGEEERIALPILGHDIKRTSESGAVICNDSPMQFKQFA